MAPTLPNPSPRIAVDGPDVRAPVVVPAFDDLYRDVFPFVWRAVRRLGVDDSAVEDVAQEIFVAVHRRLETFEGRSSLRTWIFGIVAHTVRTWKRTQGRRMRWVRPGEAGQLESAADPRAERAVAVSLELRALQNLLDAMDNEKREVFVLVEVGEMTVPEVADALEINLNTAYARLRAARAEFEVAVLRRRARESAPRGGFHA